jgi:hypothetical protein
MENDEIELFAHARGARPKLVAAARGETLRAVLARCELVGDDDEVLVFVGDVVQWANVEGLSWV